MRVLCRLAGITRQNYYKQRCLRACRTINEQLVVGLIQQERRRQPRLGARKLWHLLSGELALAGVGMGRDRFLGLLRRNKLLLERRRCSTQTTRSRHGFAIYPNTAKGLILTAPHQLLVSDITYIRTLEGFMYLSLVMDAYSRKIVGFDCRESLEMQGALQALSMSLKQLPADARAVHHSDRGIQYCCEPYIRRLQEAGVQISMTEENHCYENSQAERLNGILKQEYGLGITFREKAELRRAVPQAVLLYNHHRPHQSLGYRMPSKVHEEVMA